MKKNHFTTTILICNSFCLSPRMRFDLTINHFTKSFVDKDHLNIYDPNTSRPYCHVLDFIGYWDSFQKSKKIDREIFNVGDTKQNFF